MLIFYKKKRPNSRKHAALMPIFSQKNIHSLSKTQFFQVFFFKFFMKNPMLSCPYLVKQTSILSKVRFIMGQKSQQDAFFSDFSRKKEQQLVCQYFVENVGTFSKNTLFFYPYFVNKRLFSQIFMYFFFNLFLKNPLFSCPYLVKETSILTKIHYIMGQKSQQTLFSDFS